MPAVFYHFALEAGSAAALAQNRDELRAKGVEVSDIVDYQWVHSIYFKNSDGLSLEYCCVVSSLDQGDTMLRGALELGSARATEIGEPQSNHGNR